MVRPLITNPKQVIKTTLVLDLSRRVNLEKQLKHVNDRIEHYQYVIHHMNDDDNYSRKDNIQSSLINRRPRVVVHLPHEDGNLYPTSVDALEYFESRRNVIEKKIKRWEHSYQMHQSKQQRSTHPKDIIWGSGYGFIVFTNPQAAQSFVTRAHEQGIKVPINIDQQGDALTNQQVHDETTLGDTLNPLHDDMESSNLTLKQRIRLEIEKFVIKAEIATYEPQDVNWPNLFTRQRMGRLRGNLRELLILLCLIIIVVLFSAPLSLANTLRSLLTLLSSGSRFMFKIGPKINALLFRALPPFFLGLSSQIIPKIIIKLTKISKLITYGEIIRSILFRVYVYMIISNLIIPSLVITSVKGLTEFLQNSSHARDSLYSIFAPSSGAFFVNLIMQRALLQNMTDAMCLSTFFLYMVRTRRYFFWKKDLSPKEKLELAEMYDLRVEREYGYMLNVMGIAFAYGLLSPVVLCSALLYFILKHFVDKYVVAYTYGHKRFMTDDEGRPLFGAHFGMKSDYVAHRNIVRTVCALVLFNLLIMSAYMFMVFFGKQHVDSRFEPHMYLSLCMLILCIIACICHQLVYKYKFYERLKDKADITPSKIRCDVMYEVPYPYIRSLSNQ
ncbi:hypothetical protein AKO1_004078 [Acrasis kona]|uniref:CSC1/OSCA1-like 7TM region domain-containing protein n=1 Tax=Acrasis kona TaxID=1008807 RepID=A0AAW2YV84_9EUKA